MENIQAVIFRAGSKEEVLPDFFPEFPYIASNVEMDYFPDRSAPWHWHGAVELSYTKRGCMKYQTPGSIEFLPEGSAILVNANILHMTTAEPGTAQLLHIFNPDLLASPNSKIAARYITPLVTSQVESLCLRPDDPKQSAVLEQIQTAFRLSPKEFGYELKLRNTLGDIWLSLLEQAQPILNNPTPRMKQSDKVKEMMVYIHEHFHEKLTIPELATAAFLSERECFRAFRECLHTTPMEYVKNYRLQHACRLLRENKSSVTEIGQICGLGSSSYFGKTFREIMGCTPTEYRRKWQNIDS